MDPIKFSLFFVFTGLLFVVLGIPLYLKKVKPNDMYGFRTPKTMSDPEIWYAINSRGGFDFCIAGVVVMLGALLFRILLRSYPPQAILLANGGLLILALVVVIIRFVIALKRY